MKKLSLSEGIDLVNLALESCAKILGYRLGQAIWNLLASNGDKDLTEGFHNTDKDFFYWKEDGKVLACFYNNFVDLGVKHSVRSVDNQLENLKHVENNLKK